MAVEPPYGSCLKEPERVGFKIELGSVLVPWFRVRIRIRAKARVEGGVHGMYRRRSVARMARMARMVLVLCLELVEVELGLLTFFQGRQLP